MFESVLMLFITVTIEFLLLLVYFSGRESINKKNILVFSVAVNLITNPTANLLLTLVTTYLKPSISFPYLLATELLTVLVESVLINRYLAFRWSKAFVISLSVNAVSFIFGIFAYLFMSVSLFALVSPPQPTPLNLNTPVGF